MLLVQSLPFNETHILLVLLCWFLVGRHSLELIVGSKVGEVTELPFWHGGTRGRLRQRMRCGGLSCFRSFPDLEHHFVYKSPQSLKIPILPP